jgi:DNA-binding NtrC family response regulator
MARFGGNKTAVADRLGISRVTLQRKLSQMKQP